ncbi:type II secretion system protein N [Glaciecola sp. KUL10]|uniref:type II secretion system protein N n=1 Tax=Glaciecola sp. (strain KUL10) TaxID=2161813 RepID=UPI000D78C0CA|nr:type II secretion system protein N [Glaciecola sp. KUL10]GBL04385.1 general secretion pathway protein N [Glaciecola sp. KUL10]
MVKLKPWQWIVLGCLTYLVFLVKYMPANWALNQASTALPKNISVNDVEGTIWDGKISSVVISGIGISNVTWDLSFWSLFTGKISAELNGGRLRDSDSVYFKGQANTYWYNTQAFALHDFSAMLPAQSVLAQISLPVPITARGRFNTNIKELTFDQNCQTLTGTGGWTNGVVNGLQGPIEFGTFEADLGCAQGVLNVTVKPDNKLSLDATLTLQATGKYAVQGRFKIPENMPEEVQQAAVFFGTPDSQGFRIINL